MATIKVINPNGTVTYVNVDGSEVCSTCPKRKIESRYDNCHINNKTYELSTLFGIKIPIVECPSYAGVSEPTVERKPEQQTGIDSCEE